MKYSIIIPCFNEEQGLHELVQACSDAGLGNNIEVIFVDNGSSDNSLKTLKRLTSHQPNFRIVHLNENLGYGGGILAGLREARGSFVGWTHADLQTPPTDVVTAFKMCSSHNTFIKGKRKKRPLSDEVFTIGMSIFESVLLRTFLWDINAQPTVFSRKFFDLWDNPPTDFSLDLYAYHKAKTMNLKVQRFDVIFEKRKFGVSSWNFSLSSKVKFIARTLKFSFELLRR